MAVTRLSGGTTPANGSDPRTFPTIWNATADVIEANETAIDSLALTSLSGVSITSPVDNQLLTYNGTDWVNQVPATPDAITRADLPAGSVLQVVSVTKTDIYSESVAGGGFTGNINGLEATITPTSTSSKILVRVDLYGATESELGILGFRIMRDSTAIFVGDGASLRGRVTGYAGSRKQEQNDMAYIGMTCEDEPATTSALTYAPQLYNTSGSTKNVFVNRTAQNFDGTNVPRTVSTITLMEVAG